MTIDQGTEVLRGLAREQAWPGVRRAGETNGGRRGRGEEALVPEATFVSYYGKPVLKEPVWNSPDIPGYLFLGGLAAGSALLGAGGQLTGRTTLATRSKVAALVAA